MSPNSDLDFAIGGDTENESSDSTVDLLIVEDNQADRELFKEYLSEDPSHDYSITEKSRFEGLQSTINELNPDILFLDLNLPDSSASQTIEALNELSLLLPIVVTTGLDDREKSQQALENGAQDYIVKSNLNERLIDKTVRYATLRFENQAKDKRTRAIFQEITSSLTDSVIMIMSESNGSKPADLSYVSPSYEEVWGGSLSDLRENPSIWMEHVHSNDLQCEDDLKNELFSGNYDKKFRIRDSSGNIRWIWDRAFVTNNQDGERRIVRISTDITEQRRIQEEKEILEESSRKINQANSFQQAMDRSLELVCDNTPFVACEAWVPAQDHTKLRNHSINTNCNDDEAAQDEIRSATEGRVISNDYGFPGWIQEIDELQWISDFNEVSEDRFARKKSALDSNLKACVGFPVRSDGELLAIYVFYMDFFQPEDARYEDILEALSEQLGTLFDQKITEEKLRKSEKWAKEQANFIDAINDNMPGIAYRFKVNPEGEYSFPYMSNGLEELLGVPASAVEQNFESALRNIPDDQVDDILESVRISVENKEPWEYEIKAYLSPNEEKWIKASSVPEERSDGSLVFSGVMTDITSRKQMEQSLATQNQRRELAQNIASLGHWRIDLTEYVVHLSKETKKIIGAPGDYTLTVDEAVNYYHARDRDRVRNQLERCIESGDNIDLEAKLKRNDGKLIDVALYGRIRYRKDGSPEEFFGIIQDITERKSAENKLRKSRERFTQLAENIDEIFWMFSHDFNELLFINDDQYREIWGRNPDVLRQEPRDFLEGVHPEYHERAVEAMQSLMDGQSQELELKLNSVSQSNQWVFVEGVPILDEDGNVSRITGTVTDVTERKRAENALRESQERFRQIADNIDQIFWLTDKDKNLIYVNPAFEEIWSLSREKVYDDFDNLIETIHPEDRERIKSAMFNDQLSGDYDVEYRIVLPDGDVRWIRDRAFPVEINDENTRVAGIAEDITERREREKELRLKNRAIDEAPIGITITDATAEDNPMIYVNDHFCEMTGYPAGEALDRNCRFLQGNETREKPVKKMRQAVDEEQNITVELRNYRYNGDEFWNRVSFAPIRNDEGIVTNYVGFQQDITQMKNLQRQRELFVELVENSPSFIIRTTLDGELRYINASALDMLGFDKTDAVPHQYYWDFFEDASEEGTQQIHETIMNTGHWSDKKMITNPGEKSIHLLINAFLLEHPETDKPYEFAFIGTDISQQHEIENKLRKTIDEKEVLLQEVHHRVKNNLQVILGLIGLQRRKIDNPSAKNALQQSKQRIHSMAMIHEKLYQGTDVSSVSFEAYVRDLVYHVIDTYTDPEDHVDSDLSIQYDNLSLEFVIPCGLIINELVTNSLQHAFDDGNYGRISVKFDYDEDEYVLKVGDNGKGVDREDLFSSSSLGIKLVKNLAENQLNGKIDVEQNSGLIVTVRFNG